MLLVYMYIRYVHTCSPIANTNRDLKSRDGYMYGSEMDQQKARKLVLTCKLITNCIAQDPAEEEVLHDYNLLLAVNRPGCVTSPICHGRSTPRRLPISP